MSRKAASPSTGSGADVVVVGGGIVGSCVARELATRGASVVLVDPAAGQGASWGNAGIVTVTECRTSGPEKLLEAVRLLAARGGTVGVGRPYSADLLSWIARYVAASFGAGPDATTRYLRDLAQRSLATYRELAQAHGLDLGFREGGWLWVFEDARTQQRTLHELRPLTAIGAEIESVTADDCRRMEPSLSAAARGGLLFTRDAHVDPTRAAASILSAAVEAGAQHRAETVTGLTRRSGKVTAVETASGRIAAGAVVLCAGMATRALARSLGMTLPLVAGWGWSLTVPAAERRLERPLLLAEANVVVSPLRDSLRVTTGMQLGRRRPAPPTAEQVDGVRRAVARLVPGLGPLHGGVTWTGARPMTPSGLPIIRRATRHPNVVLATGHGWLGVTLAPATAATVAQIVCGDGIEP